MTTRNKYFIWIVYLCLRGKHINSQVCTGTEEMGWPGGGDANSVGKKLDSFGAGRGYLIPLASYTASCCGYVNQIEAFHDSLGTTTTQVWRLTSASSYTLVGAIDITGVRDISYNVPAANQVRVKIGDVVGWYSSSANLVRHDDSSGLNGNLHKASSVTAVGTTVDWSSASTENDATYAMKFHLGASSVPTFTNLPTQQTVTNAAAVTTSVYTVSATDADVNDVATLTITRTDTNSFFLFDSATKQVTIGSVLAGAVGDHLLIFTVSDSCGTATNTLTITVTNAPPTIHNLDNSTSISENTQVATLLYTLSVTDPTDTVSCTLVTAASVPFTVRQIAGSTNYGIYSTSNPGFSYDTKNNYPLSIRCTDGYDPVTGTFTVYLLRNSAPIIINLPAQVNVSTASTTGSVVYTVSSTDAENDQLYYNMTCTPASCPFTILDSGVIQVTQSLRGLTTVGYDVKVWVYDGRTLVGSKTLTVDITDINGAVSINNLPLGSALPIFENTALPTSVFQVSVTDSNVGDTHTYTMTSSPGSGMNYFSIDRSTGLISTSGTVLNYETLTTKTFDFTITVSDGSSTDSKILSIQVVNENESPSFNQAVYSISTNEAASGTILSDPGYGVTDPDARDTGDTKSFSNDCGTNTGLFSMSSATGRLTLAADYDYDIGTLPTTVTCTVKVTDSGGLTATATLSVTFNNINDNTPIFVPSSYTFFASYDATVSMSIGSVTATDRDLGTYGVVSYSLDQSSLPSAYFGIDGTNGNLYISSSVKPIGTGNSVSFKAIATDGGGLTSTTTVTVKIAITTTVTTTTTTDRYRTFLEDGRNIVWIVLCILVMGVIVIVVFWIACKTYINGCPKFKCCQKRERIIKRKFTTRRPPSPPPKQPRKMPTFVPTPKSQPPPPPPPPLRQLPQYDGFAFWKEDDFSKKLLMFK